MRKSDVTGGERERERKGLVDLTSFHPPNFVLFSWNMKCHYQINISQHFSTNLNGGSEKFQTCCSSLQLNHK